MVGHGKHVRRETSDDIDEFGHGQIDDWLIYDVPDLSLFPHIRDGSSLNDESDGDFDRKVKRHERNIRFGDVVEYFAEQKPIFEEIETGETQSRESPFSVQRCGDLREQ